MLEQIQVYIQALAEKWAKIDDQWTDPNVGQCVDFIVEEAGEAHSSLIRLTFPYFTRNNPFPVKVEDVDEEVADTLIMCLRYFNLRGILADEPVLGKLARMDEKKRRATGPMSPEHRSIL